MLVRGSTHRLSLSMVTLLALSVYHSQPHVSACTGALNTTLPYGPAVVDHCILTAGLPPQQLVKQAAVSPDQQQGLLTAVLGWEKWLDDCETHAPKGYVTYRRAGWSSQVYSHESVLAQVLVRVSCMWTPT